ncbi:MAG: hypothetical protein ACRDQI_16940 [Pseudonocardiaceae bacterium]
MASLIARFRQVDRPGLQFGQGVGQLRAQPGGEVQPRARGAAGQMQYRGDLVGGELIRIGAHLKTGEAG